LPRQSADRQDLTFQGGRRRRNPHENRRLAMAKRQIPVNAMVEQRSYLSGDLVLQTTETDLKSASKRTHT